MPDKCSSRSVNQRTKLTMRHGFLCDSQLQEGPPGTGQRFSSICCRQNALHQALISATWLGDPLDLTGVNLELRREWAFITDPQKPQHPNTQAPFPLLHPHLPRGHRNTLQTSQHTAQHNTQPSPPRCPADTPPALGLSQAPPPPPALGLSPPPPSPALGLLRAPHHPLSYTAEHSPSTKKRGR